MHVSYKPPSAWWILIRSGGLPGQFISLKNSRHLAEPGGILLQGDVYSRGLYFPQYWLEYLVTLRIKYICNAITYTCTHPEDLDPYGNTVRPIYEKSGDPKNLTHKTIHIRHPKGPLLYGIVTTTATYIKLHPKWNLKYLWWWVIIHEIPCHCKILYPPPPP